MKKTLKFIQTITGIIAFIAIIGFSIVACKDEPNDDGNGGGGNNSGGGGNQTPVASDYTFGNLNQTAGSVTDVTITPKDGKSSGARTIKYNGNTTIPQTIGTYAVTFDVAAATGWNTATGLSAGNLIVVTLSGSNQIPVASDYTFGNMNQIAGSVTAVTITANSGKSTGTVSNILYSGNTTIPQTIGTYAVTFDVAAATGWNAATGLSAGNLKVTASGENLTWTIVESTVDIFFYAIYSIIYSENKFIAGGYNGRMAQSSDGISWTEITNSVFYSYYDICGIAYGGNRYVTVGKNGTIAYSSNSTTWTKATSPFAFADTINAIAYGDGKFVAVGDNGKIAYSSNGVNWNIVTNSTFDSSSSIKGIAYGGGKFVAVGDNGKIAYSSDGVTWSSVTDSTFNNSSYIRCIAYGGNRFVVAGQNASQIAHSTDGVTWIAVTNNALDSYDIIYGIAYGSNKFVTAGSSGKTAYSTDGITWAAVNDSTESFYSIAYGGDKFVVGGLVYGKVAYSNKQE
jgi:hypothetical protein